MLLRAFHLSVILSVFAFVKCQDAESTTTPDAEVDTEKKVGIVYLIPLFQAVPKERTENEDSLNGIDTGERKVLPLPRLLLILAPARNAEVSDHESVASEAPISKEPISQERTKRSFGKFGGGCNTCGGGGYGGGGHGGGGRGNSGGGGGSWSTSSSSASSGSYGGGGNGGRYGHGRR